MKKGPVRTDAGRQYVKAYEKHYTSKDLYSALLIYKCVAASYPDSKEAGYSRSQIQNIFRDVVPGEVLYEFQLNMALDYAKRNAISMR